MYYITYDYYDKRHYCRSKILSVGDLETAKERYQNLVQNKNLNLADIPRVFTVENNKRKYVKLT